MRPCTIALLALFCAAPAQSVTLAPPAPADIAADRHDVIDDREIVVLAETRSAGQATIRRAAARGYRLKRQDDLVASLGLVQLVLAIPKGTTGAEAIRELEALVPGTTAGVNHAYRPQDAADTARRYAAAEIRWPAQGCAAVRPVGVIDTAANLDQPLFRGMAVHQRIFVAKAAHGHGDDVLSLMAAPRLLTAPRLYIAGVVGSLEDGDAAAGVDAIVRSLGWLGASRVKLVNISLAGPYNKILDMAVQRAAARGMLIVAATGNDGASSPPRYPAAFKQVIAVTAVDAAQRLYKNAVKGSHVDVAAPGVDIFIPVDGAYKSGTSYAAPYVTAYFAARKGALPDPANARAILARHSRDLGAAGRDPAFGWGLLNAGDAC